MSATSVQLASVDWATVAAAIGTLVATIFLSVKGAQKGKKQVEEGKSEMTAVVGASLIESTSIQTLSEQLRENTIALRESTAEQRRANDIYLMMHHK